jgi:hypothetical protein
MAVANRAALLRLSLGESVGRNRAARTGEPEGVADGTEGAHIGDCNSR